LKCPKCVKLGLKSTVTIDHSPRMIPAINIIPHTYYDEEGKYHDHTTPNSWDYMRYHCSNKHNFITTHARTCSCGWSSGEDKTEIWDDDKEYPTSENGCLFSISAPVFGEARIVDLDIESHPARVEIKGKHNPDGTTSILEETVTDIDGTVRTKFHRMEHDSI